MKIGIICPSEIALRRFMPALQLCNDIEFVGLAIYTPEERYGSSNLQQGFIMKKIQSEYEKAAEFVEQYGGKIFNGYETIVKSKEIDAIYIPLPPALHYKWAKMALEYGKHVLVEKPSTINKEDTVQLTNIAADKGLAFHENYMFLYHNQLTAINEIINSGRIGNVRLIRISFGFPMRATDDFRYDKALGGGALIDAGGYTIKYASHLLGDSAEIKSAYMNTIEGFDVDMYGSATMINKEGLTAQIAFGIDNNYKCDLEVWGSKGCLSTGRVLTAPVGFVPKAVIREGNEEAMVNLPADDAFKKSIEHFKKCVDDYSIRKDNYSKIIRQAELVDQFKRLSGDE